MGVPVLAMHPLVCLLLPQVIMTDCCPLRHALGQLVVVDGEPKSSTMALLKELLLIWVGYDPCRQHKRALDPYVELVGHYPSIVDPHNL
jgi:hypothetical protein